MNSSKILWVIVSAFVGGALGIGVYTFHFAKGGSYFSNSSTACANCHIMREHLHAWNRSSHKHFAQCNDCHSQDALLAKYFGKAQNGVLHSIAFTTGIHPDPLQINSFNKEIVEASCRRCHKSFSHVSLAGDTDKIMCTKCHKGVGHMLR